MPPERPGKIDQPKDSKESEQKAPKAPAENQDKRELKQKVTMILKWLTNSESKQDRKAREDALKAATEKIKKLMPELKVPDLPNPTEWVIDQLKQLDFEADKMDPMSDYICEHHSEKFFRYIENNNFQKDSKQYLPLLEKAARNAADKDPRAAIYYFNLYESQPYAKEVLEKAASNAADKDLVEALRYFNLYQSEPYAKEVLEKAVRNAADKDPRAALEYFIRYKSEPYAKEVLEKVARNLADKDPVEALRYFNLYQSEPYAKEVLEKIGSSLAVELSPEVALIIVQTINRLHESKDDLRFAITNKLDASSMYSIMIEGDREIFTSSFNGLFNRLLSKMRTEGKKGDQMMSLYGGTKGSRTFLRLCASYNRLDEFLATMDSVKSQELLRSSVMDLDTSSEDHLSDAVTLADTFSVLKDPALMSSMGGFVKVAYAKAEKERDTKAMRLYGLLASVAANKMADPWFAEMALKYPLENVSSLASKELFNPDHKNIQQYFFYNDQDGKDSFANFLRYYRSQSDWKIEDRGSYVQISKKEKDKTVEIYANKPENEDDGPEDIQKIFATKNIKTIVVVHRGHSYHAAQTIARITDIARIVWMGSCGGYNEVAAVLGKSPKAHIISTKGTGTMLVNDPLLKALNDTILSGKDIVWPAFWTDAEKKLGKNGSFYNYVSPDKNLGVNFLKAYQKQ